MIIDAHSHLDDKQFMERLGVPTPANMVDVEGLLDAQSEAGIGLSVFSGPRLQEVGAEAGLDPLDAAREYNDFAAELTVRHAGRLLGLGQAHPMGGDDMLSEMERAVRDLGLKGFLVTPAYGDQFIDAPEAFPFFELCQELGVVAFVHNRGAPIGLEHMADYRLVELVGNPNEMTLAATRLIFSGLMERLPRLKLFLGRLGGAITMYAGRIQVGWETRESRNSAKNGGKVPPWGPDNLSGSFMDSLRRIHVCTQTFHAPAIACAVGTLGADRVLFGTDYPPVPRALDLSIQDVHQAGLSDGDLDKIMRQNAERLFGL